MSFDFTYTLIWALCFLANAPEFRYTELYNHSADIWFVILVHSQVNKAAYTGWAGNEDYIFWYNNRTPQAEPKPGAVSSR